MIREEAVMVAAGVAIWTMPVPLPDPSRTTFSDLGPKPKEKRTSKF